MKNEKKVRANLTKLLGFDLDKQMKLTATSKRELARALGVAKSTVFGWFSGRSMPYPATAARIKWLLTGK